MPEKKPASKGSKGTEVFTDDERAAMKDYVQEKKKAAGRSRAGSAEADGEQDVLAKIAEMPEPDRDMAERLHALIKASTPELSAKTWYGMPAWAKDGQMICFFQSSRKFKTRYSTLGFSDKANLDEGAMWPTSYALMKWTAADEKRIGALLKKALS